MTILETDVKVDIGLFEQDDLVDDVEIGEDGDLRPTYGFDTSIKMDGFCERRADENEIIIAKRRRGWIGNESAEQPGFEVGSKVWLYYQAKNTVITRNALVDAFRNAYAWYVPQFCKSIEVKGFLRKEGIEIEITIVRKLGKVDKLYFRLWELTGA